MHCFISRNQSPLLKKNQTLTIKQKMFFSTGHFQLWVYKKDRDCPSYFLFLSQWYLTNNLFKAVFTSSISSFLPPSLPCSLPLYLCFSVSLFNPINTPSWQGIKATGLLATLHSRDRENGMKLPYIQFELSNLSSSAFQAENGSSNIWSTHLNYYDKNSYFIGMWRTPSPRWF